MQRYFANDINDNKVKLSENDLHHIYRVMRNRPGDQILCVFNEQTYLCVLNHEDIEIVRAIEENHELDVDVTLVYGLPKGDKLEFVVQKACELGVKRIVPYLSKRSIIKTDKDKFEKKRERLIKIAKEAAEQSTRLQIPEITPLCLPKELGTYLSDINLVAYEENSRLNEHSVFSQALNQLKANSTITIIVGPEGGFDEKEIKEMEHMGFRACSLGKRILRSETAPLYMLSVIGYKRELES